ncbi:Mg-dependent DNase [Spiroplasma sp. TIUS-1]|uniref:TatD family hydrolase n=1 Tax=Spiroplasma sp. TIUS-1 TaxID=216963 RepID=UPI0013984725|nr:TatD family hydrolase [Spiroplasma sp. TIUS-1]QHX36249.1 Mg-dependent DNase [Spiroplasma sp. TIUS-1]
MKNITLIDCHTHFHDDKYTTEGYTTNDLIDDAINGGVKYFMSTGYDVASSKASVRDAMKHKSVFAVIGIHPNNVEDVSEIEIAEIAKLAKLDKVKGIGEIGLDFYYSDKNKDKQMFIFEEQVKIAKENNLVVVLHIRDQKNHTDVYYSCLKMLIKHKIKKAMVHCFTADQAVADAFIKEGYYISIGGVVTFPNAKELQHVVEKVPMKYLVTETDAPYLTPVPYRGTTNRQEYIIHTIKKMAELKKISTEEMAEVTYSNAKNLFGLV